MITIYDANAYIRRSLNRQQFAGEVAMDPRLIYNRANAAQVPEIWVWDGANNNERRRAIFPGYKIRDYTGQESIFAGLQLYREVLGHSNALQIEVPSWEADDVCYTLTHYYVSKGQRVTIHTNDFDFHQLSALPGVKVNGASGPADVVAPHHISVYKALVGDKSDKIPGMDGFGPKTWLAFRGLYDSLETAMLNRDATALRQHPWKKSHAAWLMDDANVNQLFDWHQITKMLEVPMAEIEQHMRPGVYNPHAAEQLFMKFML
jgi:5'-3' exonuclease